MKRSGVSGFRNSSKHSSIAFAVDCGGGGAEATPQLIDHWGCQTGAPETASFAEQQQQLLFDISIEAFLPGCFIFAPSQKRTNNRACQNESASMLAAIHLCQFQTAHRQIRRPSGQ